MNKFIGVGNLTKDGELRSTESGKIIYSNSLAMRNDFKNKDGEYDTEFINFSAWGSTAEYLKKYAKKGNKILIEGRISTRSYDAQDGTKRYTTDVVVDNFEFVGSSKGNESIQSSSSNSTYSNFNNNSNMQTADLSEDPYKEFSEETSISSDEFPF